MNPPENETPESEHRLGYGKVIRVDPITPDLIERIFNEGLTNNITLARPSTSPLTDNDVIATTMIPQGATEQESLRNIYGNTFAHVTALKGGGIISVIDLGKLPSTARIEPKGVFPPKHYPGRVVGNIELPDQETDDNQHWEGEVHIRLPLGAYIKPEGVMVHKDDLPKLVEYSGKELLATPVEDTNLIYIKVD